MVMWRAGGQIPPQARFGCPARGGRGPRRARSGRCMSTMLSEVRIANWGVSAPPAFSEDTAMCSKGGLLPSVSEHRAGRRHHGRRRRQGSLRHGHQGIARTCCLRSGSQCQKRGTRQSGGAISAAYRWTGTDGDGNVAIAGGGVCHSGALR